MCKGLGLPYMGSKRKLAPKIVEYIIANNPDAKYFYDLFGGGGAISFYAMQTNKFKQVFYNELNTGVVELLRKIQKEGVTEEFYQWVDKDIFDKHKNDNDWFGGLCKVVWSFGNNQREYLFSKIIEPIKKLAHEYLFMNGYDKTSKKRVELVKQFKLDGNIINSFGLQRLEQLERLQQLEQLERLEQLEQLEQLEIYNLSYEQVEIETPVNETIIYLDPPYKGTKKYQKDIDHDKLKEYIHTSPYKIYLSSYDNIYDMNEVLRMNHMSTICATATNKVVEKLFCNIEENEILTLF